jgi:hypothetical protein
VTPSDVHAKYELIDTLQREEAGDAFFDLSGLPEVLHAPACG